MSEWNPQVKHLIALLLFFSIRIAYAIPLCALQAFDFSIEDVAASLAISPPGHDDNIFFLNVSAKTGSDYIGKILIFDDVCNLLYNKKLEYYPISIFSFDDGTSGMVFNLKQSGNGTYMLDAYHIQNSLVTQVMTDVPSKKSRPSFIDYSNLSLTAPDVKICFNECNVYRFNDKEIKYIIIPKQTKLKRHPAKTNPVR
jgi:hypothetical protein